MKKKSGKELNEEEKIVQNLNEEFAFLNELSRYNEDKQKITEIIQTINNPIFLCNFIEDLSYSRCFLYKYLADIFEICVKSARFETIPIIFPKYNFFTAYLIKRGLITEHNINEPSIMFNIYNKSDLSFYEEPFEKESLQYYISRDDVSGFVSYSTLHRCDLNKTIITIYDTHYFVIELSCKVSAIGIIRYCFLNNIKREGIQQFAVSSGSEEVIELLISNGYSMNNLAYTAILHHQNNLAKLLYENYENNPISFNDCLECSNVEMFYYFLTQWNVFDINDIDFNGFTPLHYAAKLNALNLAHFLLIKGADKTAQDNKGKSPCEFEYITVEMKELLDSFDAPLVIDI